MTDWQSADDVRAQALGFGFDVCGIADVTQPWTAGDDLRAYVAEGFHADMDWMAETLERRVHPQAMWPDARTAIVLGVNYAPETNPLTALEDGSKAAISVYASNDDYHDLIKKRLKAFASELARHTGAEVKVFVDTAPLLEKPLAQLAGLGFQGKHTVLVSRAFGNYLFLGTILTTLSFAPDLPETNHCGTCTACLDICPTKAFPAPFQLDSRKCLAYLSVEHKGPIPPEFRKAMGNRVYGCDDCIAVCPWNKFARATQEAAFLPRAAVTSQALLDLVTLDDATFRTLFAKSPIKRIGRARFVRNVLIALGNSGDPKAMDAVEALILDEEPLVRGAAIWALAQLDLPHAVLGRARHFEQETDQSVRAEWLGLDQTV